MPFRRRYLVRMGGDCVLKRSRTRARPLTLWDLGDGSSDCLFGGFYIRSDVVEDHLGCHVIVFSGASSHSR